MSIVLAILRNALQCRPNLGLGTAVALFAHERGRMDSSKECQSLLTKRTSAYSVEETRFSGSSIFEGINVAIASWLKPDHFFKSGRCRGTLTPT